MDSDNLRTASLYINNQLLSRGLLRDGQKINFTDPEVGDGGLQATMGHIMSVVNDLILRRDRDAEHRESLSTTLRTLRVDSQRQIAEFVRQTDKLNDTRRKLDTAEATERTLRTQLKMADNSIHKLRDETAKMKSMVAQTRAACANESRKRDRQIDGLKKAVTEAGRVRGGGKSSNVLTIHVTGEVGDGERGMPPGATEAEGYDLRMETNEFLTELARGLSEENEGLLALVKSTVDGLRGLTGLERTEGAERASNGPGSRNTANQDDHHTVQSPVQRTTDELATELEAIMEHLRNILTNPSFVPIEEVEVREEIIQRLRAGLETMEDRWKDAVQLIDGWRRRMLSSGQSVDIDDLRMGLLLSPVRVQDIAETSGVVPMRLSCVREEEEEEEEEAMQEAEPQEEEEPRRPRSPSPVESLHLVPAPGYELDEENDDSGSDSDSSIFQDDVEVEELDTEEPNVEILQESTTTANSAMLDSSLPLPEPPQLSPLKDSYSSGNRGLGTRSYDVAPSYRKRPGDFTTIIEEKTWDLAAAEDRGAPIPTNISRYHPLEQERSSGTLKPISASYDSPLFGKSGERPSQAMPSKKLFSKPSPTTNRPPQSPGLDSVVRSTTHQNVSPESTTAARPASSSAAAKTHQSAENRRAISGPNPPRHVHQQQSPVLPAPTVHLASKSLTDNPAANAVSIKSNGVGEHGNRRPAEQPTRNSRSPVRNTNNNNNVPQIQASSRLPRPNTVAQQPQQSPLTMATIAAKLAATEREADAARVRAKLKAVRKGRKISPATINAPPSTSTTTAAAATAAELSETANGSSLVRGGKGIPTAPDTLEDLVDPVKKDVEPLTTLGSSAHSSLPHSRSANIDHDTKQEEEEEEEENHRARNDDNHPHHYQVADDELALSGSNDVSARTGSRRRRRRESTAHDLIAVDETRDEHDDDDLMRLEKPRTRKRERRTSKAASRRRSTLSPWELESLIRGDVVVGGGGIPPSAADCPSPAR